MDDFAKLVVAIFVAGCAWETAKRLIDLFAKMVFAWIKSRMNRKP